LHCNQWRWLTKYYSTYTTVRLPKDARKRQNVYAFIAEKHIATNCCVLLVFKSFHLYIYSLYPLQGNLFGPRKIGTWLYCCDDSNLFQGKLAPIAALFVTVWQSFFPKLLQQLPWASLHVIRASQFCTFAKNYKNNYLKKILLRKSEC